VFPQVTPDGRSVIFSSTRNGVQSPWLIPIEGGTPKQLINMFAGPVDFSPDGRSIAFGSQDNQGRPMAVICGLPDCASRKSIHLGNAGPDWFWVKWILNGRALAYIDRESHSNLWVQPVDGSTSYQLTHFTDGRIIGDFAWSRDGEHLAISRATVTSDIVLFTPKK
jgi:Tol biopolymer transport system component